MTNVANSAIYYILSRQSGGSCTLQFWMCSSSNILRQNYLVRNFVVARAGKLSETATECNLQSLLTDDSLRSQKLGARLKPLTQGADWLRHTHSILIIVSTMVEYAETRRQTQAINPRRRLVAPYAKYFDNSV
eukprot:6213349-Pleurochrysis_carterae.AAC.3